VNRFLQDAKFGQQLELLLHVIHVMLDSTKIIMLVLNVQIIALLVLLIPLVVLVYQVLIKTQVVHVHNV